ncbi:MULTISPECIES: P-loop NTPase fold protein [unclassified Rathayibacter]|uniref:KAP family P-loop NTPase fold protein n=1 Tax=unclassified Rathayibacter TaxID=2609250 RepID=UPI0015E2B7DC|nr:MULTISPECIES: P-loop NTPase fold protein [unclassified Rathayibacter]
MPETETTRPMWTDEPFNVDSEDSFGRASFTDTIVKRIQSASATDSSTVFGLVGPWGSGKTSISDRVRVGLANDWLIADFTPWSSGDAASMSLEFVSTLADLLGEKAAGESRAKLASYAGFIAPLLGAIPVVGGGVKGAAEHALDAIASRPPWHKQFAEFAKLIQSLEKRVLIVIDDVDRLGGSELLTLLRIIRLLGRFRGVHYLIAYDQDTVEDLLRSTGSVGRSSAFMEKIVQYPFEVPPIPRAAAIRLLNGLIEELLAVTNTRLEPLDLQRASGLVDALAPQLRTPRGLGRFKEHLAAFAEHVPAARLDLLDYIAVTWLRLNAHGVWSQLESWYHELTSGERATSVTAAVPLTADDWEDRIAAAHPQAHRAGTLEVLSFLFEGVDIRGRRSFATHPRAMNDRTYFGRYLLLAIPEDDVDDELIRMVGSQTDIDKFEKPAGELAKIIDGSDDSLAHLALTRLAALRSGNEIPNPLLLKFLSDRIKLRNGEDERVGSPRNGSRVLLAREVAVSILAGEISAEAVIELLGEEESLTVVWMVPRSAEFRGRGREIADHFARLWASNLRNDPSRYMHEGRLGAVAEVVTYCLEPKETEGLLDGNITDFDSLLKIAKEFVYVAEWVGNSLSYELRFRKDVFQLLVSAAVRQQYRSAVLGKAGQIQYETEDRPSREISEEVLLAFANDSLSALYT